MSIQKLRPPPLRVIIAAIVIAGSAANAQRGFDANGTCVGDGNGNDQVSVDELVTAVNNALEGCERTAVTLQFRAVVGDRPFACGQLYSGIGTSAADFIPADLRFYVHGVRLIDAAGREVPFRFQQDGVWQQGEVALLDFEDKTPPCRQGTAQTNTVLHGSIPAGSYTGLRFSVGVPFDLNHANAATADPPLNLTAMFWSWQAGYKFFRLDEATDAVRVHIGSTGCEYGGGTPNEITRCERLNRGEVILRDFDPLADTIVVDIGEILADSDLTANQPDTAPGCESNPEDRDCEPIFRHLGIEFANGLPDPAHQSVFRTESGRQ
jgi:uncharacterized repeat protein (TIGR04052 family)